MALVWVAYPAGGAYLRGSIRPRATDSEKLREFVFVPEAERHNGLSPCDPLVRVITGAEDRTSDHPSTTPSAICRVWA